MSADCAQCGTGTYQTGIGFTAVAACTKCTAGTYQTGSGITASADCTLCMAGTYQTGTGIPGSAGCSKCAEGTYSTGVGMAAAAAACQACAKGTYSTAQGLQASASCVACAGGTFSASSGATSSSACTTCLKGTYAAGGATVCSTCPADSSTASSGSAVSTDCVCNGGKFGDPFSQQGCGSCAPNFYCTSTTQIACPDGYFSLGGSTDSSACKCQPNAAFVAPGGCTCNDGFSKEARSPSQSFLGDRECVQCPPNFFCKSDLTTGCPDNSLSVAGSALVTSCKCNAGYFWDSATNTCPACPPGSYCKNNLKSACPDNTNSPALSSLQSQCACNAGFKCRKVRDVRLALKFQLSRLQYDAQADAIKANIAKAAGVDVSSVSLTASLAITTETTAAVRRLLGAPPDDDPRHQMLEVSAHIAVQSGTDLTTIV